VLLFFKRVLVLDRAEQELEPEKPENPKIQKSKNPKNQNWPKSGRTDLSLFPTYTITRNCPLQIYLKIT
jgi:hypothetical protein